MDNYIPQQQLSMQRIKEEYYKQALGSTLGLTQQGQNTNQCTPASPGIVSMTEDAHSAFQSMCEAFSELRATLGPLIEPYPELNGEACQNQTCEAAAVTGLRMLVERIYGKTSEIRSLTAALRV